MKKAILVASIFIAIATVGCKKDDDDDTTPATAEDVMVSTSWKIDTIGWDLDENGEIDAALPVGYIKPCDLDNTLTFMKDSTGIFDEGPSICDSTSEQTVPFTWKLSENDSIMTIDGVPGELDGDVKVLLISNTNLKFSKRVHQDFPVSFDELMIIALKK
jgi:hypothetical protein